MEHLVIDKVDEKFEETSKEIAQIRGDFEKRTLVIQAGIDCLYRSQKSLTEAVESHTEMIKEFKQELSKRMIAINENHTTLIRGVNDVYVEMERIKKAKVKFRENLLEWAVRIAIAGTIILAIVGLDSIF